jgi:hypothetical protein
MGRSLKGTRVVMLSTLVLMAGLASAADEKTTKDKETKGKEDKPFQKLINRNSEKAVGVLNKSTKNGAACVQWDFKSNEPNQQWRVVPASGGWSYIENANSKTFLSVKIVWKNERIKVGKVSRIVKKFNGADVCISDKSAGDASQMWKLVAVPKEKGWYRLVNRAGQEAGLVLTVKDGSQNNGGKLGLIVDQKGQAKSQHWKFENLDAE